MSLITTWEYKAITRHQHMPAVLQAVRLKVPFQISPKKLYPGGFLTQNLDPCVPHPNLGLLALYEPLMCMKITMATT